MKGNRLTLDYNTLSLPLLEARTDWITATAQPGQRSREVRDYVEWQLELETIAGERRRPLTRFSYRGWHAGAWSYGDRADGTLVMVTGAASQAHAGKLASLTDHWSRVDYCATVRAASLDFNPLEDYRDGPNTLDQVSQRRHKSTRITGSDDGRTFYVGSRSSARFVRIYDKSAESRGVYPPGSWRFELECKGRIAEQQQARMMQGPLPNDVVADLIHTEVSRVGYVPPWRRGTEVVAGLEVRHKRDLDRSIEWLRTQVGPTARFVAGHLGVHEVIEILGLLAVPIDNSRECDGAEGN